MERIASFSVDHDKIVQGIYVSRIDGDIVTYDLRTRIPNGGDYIDTVTMHSVEHMLATYLRNSEMGKSIIYFGPMGCGTGFYLLVRGERNERVLEVLKDCLKKTVEHDGEMFGNTRKDSSSTVALLACSGLLSQVGKPHVRVIGDINETSIRKKATDLLDAVAVAEGLKRSSYGMVGGRSIGIGTTVADPTQWQKQYGVEFDHCDQ